MAIPWHRPISANLPSAGAFEPEARRKLAGGGARNERNHWIARQTRRAPEGAPEIPGHNRRGISAAPSGAVGDFNSVPGGSAALHHRLISAEPQAREQLVKLAHMGYRPRLVWMRAFGPIGQPVARDFA